MARRNPHIISIRVDDDMLKQIGHWAKAWELYNAKGDLNISETAKLLLSIGLKDYEGQNFAQSQYKIARAAVWNDLKIRINTVLRDLSDEF